MVMSAKARMMLVVKRKMRRMSGGEVGVMKDDPSGADGLGVGSDGDVLACMVKGRRDEEG